jgi:DNA-3-methyladenine glycosylase I
VLDIGGATGAHSFWLAQNGSRRLWLITMNDNAGALRFYQRRGFDMVASHRDALELSRRMKPPVPATGANGIPIRREIELERRLTEEEQ